jgi:hypothetical protein
MSSVARKGNSMSRVEQIEPKVVAKVEPSAAEPTMEQVRELLFGQTQRSNEQRAQDLHAMIEAMGRDMKAQFAAVEATMQEAFVETARRHSTTIEAIGAALTDLGAQVRKLAEPPSRK